jgi:hypothetical protein
MHLQGSLAAVGAFGKPEYFPDVRRNIDREWVEQALQATGTATIRRRRLPAEQVVWLVIGMALYRNRSIHDIVSKLDLVLPGESPTVVPSAVADARARLGAEPMEWLFTRCADEWAHSSARRHAWRGLAIYGLDGSTLRVPDSDENRATFGVTDGHRGESESGRGPHLRFSSGSPLRSLPVTSASRVPFDFRVRSPVLLAELQGLAKIVRLGRSCDAWLG